MRKRYVVYVKGDLGGYASLIILTIAFIVFLLIVTWASQKHMQHKTLEEIQRRHFWNRIEPK